ncbi:MAG: putative phage protein [Paenibacillaceae bacterium]|jgi:hypothetical protein|nr:putative phage protein [Paenibacillaceae bacterium]
MAMQGEKVINGTFGELWLEGEYVAEVKGLQAKVSVEKEDIPVAGKFATDSKFIGYKGTGTLRMYKTNSRMITKLSESIKAGAIPRFQILSQVNDPSADGAERILIKDAAFDDLTLIDWELRKNGELECPFTFTDWKAEDVISAKQQ